MSTSKRYEQFVAYWVISHIMGAKRAIGSKRSLKRRESVFIDLFVAGTHNVDMTWETREMEDKSIQEGYLYVATPINN